MSSSNPDIQVADSSSEDSDYRTSVHGSRRTRQNRRVFKRRLLRTLRPGNLVRAGVVLLLPAAFIHVSLMNNVLSDAGDTAAASFIGTTTEMPALEVSTTSGTAVGDTGDTALDADSTNPIAGELATHVVPEGGSLWRTGKQFIDDEVLLDKLIDNLAARGMDVGNVRAGVQFLVGDLGRQGLRVVIESGGNTYESRVSRNEVVTRMRRTSGSST